MASYEISIMRSETANMSKICCQVEIPQHQRDQNQQILVKYAVQRRQLRRVENKHKQKTNNVPDKRDKLLKDNRQLLKVN